MANTAIHPQAKLVLPGLPGHPIPYLDVDLLVHVAKSSRLSGGCQIPKEIQDFHGTWIRCSLPSLVHWGTLHYHGVNIVQGDLETAYQSRMRKCWQTLVDFRPAIKMVKGRNRLIFSAQANPDERGGLSEVVGEALGVAVAAKILQVNKAAFKRRHFNAATRHDYDVTVGKRTVWLETRGRFNGKGKAEAMREVDEKFGRTVNRKSKLVAGKRKWTINSIGDGDFDQAIGALVYPSDNAKRRNPDVELLDPPNRSTPLSDVQRARRLLAHYLEIFRRQNLQVATKVSDWIGLEDAELDAVLVRGDEEFASPRNYPPKRIAFFGRVNLRVQGQEFFGTYFDGAAPPPWVAQSQFDTKEGVFFYGLWRRVIEKLGSFEILELLDSAEESRVTQVGSGTTFVLFDDGVLTAWAPSAEALRADAIRDSSR